MTPYQDKIIQEARAILERDGAGFLAITHRTYGTKNPTFIKFTCHCGIEVEKRVGLVATGHGFCTLHAPRRPFIGRAVTAEAISAKLEQFGSRYQSHWINDKPRYTVVQFTCKCGASVIRNWNDLKNPRRKALCQKCAQPRLRGKDHPEFNPSLPHRDKEDLRWRAYPFFVHSLVSFLSRHVLAGTVFVDEADASPC